CGCASSIRRAAALGVATDGCDRALAIMDCAVRAARDRGPSDTEENRCPWRKPRAPDAARLNSSESRYSNPAHRALDSRRHDKTFADQLGELERYLVVDALRAPKRLRPDRCID